MYVADRATATFRRASSATEPAYQPSLTRDASQVAYAVGPAGCQYDLQTFSNLESACPGTRLDVAFGPSPGFTSSIGTETISLAPNGQPAGGLNVEPALSGNGRWVAWISTAGQTLMASNDELLNGRNAFLRRRDPGLVIDPVDFGTIGANTTSTLPATVRNAGRTSVSLDAITATPGQFTIQGGGTCAGGSLLPPGATCTVNVRYAAPNNTSTTTGSITVAESGYDPISAVGRLIGRSSVRAASHDDDHDHHHSTTDADRRQPWGRCRRVAPRPPPAPPHHRVRCRSTPTPTRSTSDRSRSASDRRSRPSRSATSAPVLASS